MTESDLEPLDPALIAGLRSDFERADTVVRERVSARLASSVGALTLQRALSESGSLRPTRLLRAHSLAIITSFALGGLCGAGLYGALRPPPPTRVVYVERPTANSIPASTSTTAQSGTAPALSAAPPVAKPPLAGGAERPAPVRAGFANLAEQQALLDVARGAFARSDYSTTLDLLKTHFQRFPKSVLGEEREALAIKALAASGRRAEAQARALRFKAQFPQSLLMPSLNDSLQANP